MVSATRKRLKLKTVVYVIVMGCFGTLSAYSEEEGPLEYSPDLYAQILSVKECSNKKGLFESFINSVGLTNSDGSPAIDPATGKQKLYKGSLSKGTDLVGDRNFDFYRLQDEIYGSINLNDEASVEQSKCLYYLNQVAMAEWKQYFERTSYENKCGLSFDESVDKNGRVSYKLIKNSANKTSMCEADYGGDTYYNALVAQMEAFKAVSDRFNQKESEFEERVTKEKKEGNPAVKTEATTCENGDRCEKKDILTSTGQFFQNIENEKCCDNIKNKWNELGFSINRSSQPSDRICMNMIDKSNDHNDDKSLLEKIKSCLGHFAASFGKSAVEGFTDMFSFGFWSQVPMAIWSLISNPFDAIPNMFKGMTGWDPAYAGCLNKDAMADYACQMIGKTFGGVAGMSAATGVFVGAIKGLKLAVGAKKAFQASMTAMKPPGAVRYITEPIKGAGKEASKAFFSTVAFPIQAAKAGFKFFSLPKAAKSANHGFFKNLKTSAYQASAGRYYNFMATRAEKNAIKAEQGGQDIAQKFHTEEAEKLREKANSVKNGTNSSTNSTLNSEPNTSILAQTQAAEKNLQSKIENISKSIEEKQTKIKSNEESIAKRASGPKGKTAKNNSGGNNSVEDSNTTSAPQEPIPSAASVKKMKDENLKLQSEVIDLQNNLLLSKENLKQVENELKKLNTERAKATSKVKNSIGYPASTIPLNSINSPNNQKEKNKEKIPNQEKNQKNNDAQKQNGSDLGAPDAGATSFDEPIPKTEAPTPTSEVPDQ